MCASQVTKGHQELQGKLTQRMNMRLIEHYKKKKQKKNSHKLEMNDKNIKQTSTSK